MILTTRTEVRKDKFFTVLDFMNCPDCKSEQRAISHTDKKLGNLLTCWGCGAVVKLHHMVQFDDNLSEYEAEVISVKNH